MPHTSPIRAMPENLRGAEERAGFTAERHCNRSVSKSDDEGEQLKIGKQEKMDLLAGSLFRLCAYLFFRFRSRCIKKEQTKKENKIKTRRTLDMKQPKIEHRLRSATKSLKRKC